MGRGNWYPDHADVSEFATVQPEKLYGEYDIEKQKYECQDDPEDWASTQWRFDEFKDTVRQLLPKSFYTADRWLRNDEKVWAENGHAMIVVHEDDYSRVHVAMVPKWVDEDPARANLAIRYVAQAGPAFLDKLEPMFGPLYVRDGAWCSRLRKPADANIPAAT